MKRYSIWWSAVFAMVLGVTGCGSDDGATGGNDGAGGTARCLNESEALTSCLTP